MKARALVVAGAGTEIGKTHTSLALLEGLQSRGIHCAGLKPVETGLPTGPGPESDRERLAAAGSFHVKQWPYGYSPPVSPHLAAAEEQRPIDRGRIVAWCRSFPVEVAVVETAGGLLSPLGPDLTNLDLLRGLEPFVWCLVVKDALGALSASAALVASVAALAPELPAPFFVLSCPPDRDASTGSNLAELQRLGIARRGILLPRAAPSDPEIQAAMGAVLQCFT